jgi:hypothetical protein
MRSDCVHSRHSKMPKNKGMLLASRLKCVSFKLQSCGFATEYPKRSTKCQSCKAVTDLQTLMLIDKYQTTLLLQSNHFQALLQNLLCDFILLTDYDSLEFKSYWPKIYLICIHEHDSLHYEANLLVLHHFPNTAKIVVSQLISTTIHCTWSRFYKW